MTTRKELHKLAKKFNISDNGLNTIELIRTIQRSEGNFDCYGKATEGTCDQPECLWRPDCLLVSTAAETTHRN